MNTKIMRNVFDRHIRPTRELDRFLFELSTEPSSLLSHRTPPASHDEAFQMCPQLWGRTPDEHGNTRVIEKPKRVKRWWSTQPDGKVLLTVRYGARAIEFQKGKDAIEVENIEALPVF